MPTPRVRFGFHGDEVAGRLARELVAARAVSGLTQRQVAERAGVSQALISQAERGRIVPSLDVMHRLASAAGHDLVLRLYPGNGVRLRDSGQLQVAETIRAAASSAWRVRLEVPVGAAPDRRAVDMVLDGPAGMVAVEVERALLDLQAQLRAAQLKRAATVERTGRSAWLVIAVLDTRRNRAAVLNHRSLLAAALPVPSKRIWACLRAGVPVGGDGLLWVRMPSRGLAGKSG
ncbi:MAG: helix-turn-helix domain-containing protein [Chloroflexota bacterium]